jgi:hypothetical protein
VLSVEEEAGRTFITPLAPDLFLSGSATPNPAHAALLQRVAEAINKGAGARCWLRGTRTISRSPHCGIGTISSCHANARSVWRGFSNGAPQIPRASSGAASAPPAAYPSRVRTGEPGAQQAR